MYDFGSFGLDSSDGKDARRGGLEVTEDDIAQGHRTRWYVLHVKPRSEKVTAEWLAHYKAFHHLPTYVKMKKVQRRKVCTVLPLFPGYVFARMDAWQRRAMLETNKIVRTIEVAQPRQMIHQLRQIARAARRAPMPDALVPRAETFHAGEYVRVTAGPFYGLRGYIERTTSRLYLNVDILGRSVEIAISAADVERENMV